MTDETRALVLSNEDRQTVHALITAQLGEQGLRVTPDEFTFFIRVAELRGLNPLFREVHLIKDKSGRINVQVGIDGFRKLAEASGDYAGQTEPVWGEPYTGPIVEWQGKPAYCKVGVLRHSWSQPVYGEAWLDEDGQVKAEWIDGPGGKRTQGPATHAAAQWAQRPRTMLKKVAEARAIRAAFPRSVAGLYTDDELHAAPQLEAGPTPTASLGDGGQHVTITATESATVVGPAEIITGEEAPSGAAWTPAPDPEGVSATVREAPDGIRIVKSSAHPPRWEGTKPKLEVKVKVKGRNHTIVLLDDLAYAADAAGLLEGESLVVQGASVEERIWQEGKPPIRELWGATELLVSRPDGWLPVSTSPRAQPIGELPLVDSTAPMAEPMDQLERYDGPPEITTHPPAPARLEEGWAGALRVKLVGEITTGTTPRGKAYAELPLALLDTGELVRAVLGDDPPGEIGAQLLGDDGKSWAFTTGDVLTAYGTASKGWFILTAIGKGG